MRLSEAPNTIAEETEIGVMRAICHALANRSITHFPRLLGFDGSWTTIDDSELIRKAAKAFPLTTNWILSWTLLASHLTKSKRLPTIEMARRHACLRSSPF